MGARPKPKFPVTVATVLVHHFVAEVILQSKAAVTTIVVIPLPVSIVHVVTLVIVVAPLVQIVITATMTTFIVPATAPLLARRRVALRLTDIPRTAVTPIQAHVIMKIRTPRTGISVGQGPLLYREVMGTHVTGDFLFSFASSGFPFLRFRLSGSLIGL